MKRLCVFVVVGLLLLGGTALFADESVLIDFTKLGADTLIVSGASTYSGATVITDDTAS